MYCSPNHPGIHRAGLLSSWGHGGVVTVQGNHVRAGDEGSICLNRKLVFWFFLFCFPIRSKEA